MFCMGLWMLDISCSYERVQSAMMQVCVDRLCSAQIDLFQFVTMQYL